MLELVTLIGLLKSMLEPATQTGSLIVILGLVIQIDLLKSIL